MRLYTLCCRFVARRTCISRFHTASTLNGPFDVTELSRLVAFVKPVTASGETVVLDPHNYARYRGNVIGSSAVPDSAYADFWSRLASQFKDNKRV
ncbi:cellulase family glycosylhydrolase, partial [Paraburkholderia sp. EG304]|uniref:cellulase family glycosylhydrolase n=1 Tax=Paraburkholderia sp. EG304 TaxID=3237015 RepID=UPI00397D935B